MINKDKIERTINTNVSRELNSLFGGFDIFSTKSELYKDPSVEGAYKIEVKIEFQYKGGDVTLSTRHTISAYDELAHNIDIIEEVIEDMVKDFADTIEDFRAEMDYPREEDIIGELKNEIYQKLKWDKGMSLSQGDRLSIKDIKVELVDRVGFVAAVYVKTVYANEKYHTFINFPLPYDSREELMGNVSSISELIVEEILTKLGLE